MKLTKTTMRKAARDPLAVTEFFWVSVADDLHKEVNDLLEHNPTLKTDPQVLAHQAALITIRLTLEALGKPDRLGRPADDARTTALKSARDWDRMEKIAEYWKTHDCTVMDAVRIEGMDERLFESLRSQNPGNWSFLKTRPAR